MSIRHFKIVLVLFVGLQGWFYLAGNVANWEHGVGAVSYVISMAGHEVYPAHIVPVLAGTGWATLCYLVILAGEFSVGALSLLGCWRLWCVRKADAATFNGAKNMAIMGAAMAMVVWFGLFMVVGAALFQMWQTSVGDGSFQGAFRFAAISALVLLFVSQRDN